MKLRLPAYATVVLVAIMIVGCDSPRSPVAAAPPPTTTAAATTTTTTTTTQATSLPGVGKPPVTIGDKNFTEQFVLGELYYLALQAQGFQVQLNQNIGPVQVTMQALTSGQLDMYPEYLNVWNSQVAGLTRHFRTRHAAYVAGNRYALTHGLELLNPTPFSDTSAIAVTDIFATQNNLRKISDLQKVEQTLTLGGPPQFQQDPTGLPALESAYGLTPAAFKSLNIGDQYKALDQATVQAADVNTTDGELTMGDYTLLADPVGVFGIGNVVPVVSDQALAREGPAFADIINRVSSLLTLSVIRELNAQVDLAGDDPTTVARRFLVDHGLVPPSSGVS